MTSYWCQICRMDMSVARIRTLEDPPDAAWNYEGLNYVGFTKPRDYEGNAFVDEQCQQCTTVDRTPVNFYNDARNILSGGPLWAEEDNTDDNWLPDDILDANNEPLEYDTEAETDFEMTGVAEGDDENLDDESLDNDNDNVRIRDALCELYAPEPRIRLPHGTWLNGYIYSRDYGRALLHQVVEQNSPGSHTRLVDLTTIVVPEEHIADPSCKSLQGINGHVLSAEEMKNCRIHRFLLAKPLDWRADITDGIFEKDSLFVLSGEANGSYTTHMYPAVHPPRYGAANVPVSTLTANDASNDSDQWQPLPVHSYCLDMYAKASYRRLGRVDLDGIWHWREMLGSPESYHLSADALLPCPEVSRARKNWNEPWCHHTGEEWLAANPVEVPRFRSMLKSLFTSNASYTGPQRLEGLLFTLPAELVGSIVSFLDESTLNVVAMTCRTLRSHTQTCFKTLALRNLDWLWEIFDEAQYPSSPDRPATWDARFPSGFIPPDLPVGLETEDDENALWAQITDEDPDMRSVGAMVRTLNFLRRDAIYGPARAWTELSTREWRCFRTEVADWIRRLPSEAIDKTQELDWARLWRLCNPTTTPIHGIRNRARIWTDCQRIIDLNARLHQQGGMEIKDANVREALSWNRVELWERARSGAASALDDV